MSWVHSIDRLQNVNFENDSNTFIYVIHSNDVGFTEFYVIVSKIIDLFADDRSSYIIFNIFFQLFYTSFGPIEH